MERQIKRLAVYPHHTSCNAIMGAILFSPAVTPLRCEENFFVFFFNVIREWEKALLHCGNWKCKLIRSG